MSKSLLVNYGTLGFADNTTSYQALSGLIGNSTTTENRKEMPIREAGVFSNLFTYVSSNTTLVSSTITLKKSLVASSVQVTYTSGQTGIKEDITNTSTFAATDEGDYRISVNNDVSGAKILTVTLIGIQFEPTNSAKCFTTMGRTNQSTIATVANTLYDFINNGQGADTNEAILKYRVRSSFTASNLYVFISANTKDVDINFRTRVNGANGNQIITYTSTQTGAKEDITNTDTLSAGDDFNFERDHTTSTGGTTATLQNVSVTLIGTSNIFPLVAGEGNVEAIAFNSTVYVGISSGLAEPVTTEAFTQMYPRFDFTAKELSAYVTTNTIITLGTPVTLRDNGADSSLTVSYGIAETGLKSDITNSATITSGSDEINYSIVTPNTAGSISFTWVGMLGETAASVFDIPFRRRRIRKFF